MSIIAKAKEKRIAKRHRNARVIKSAESPMFIGLSKILDVAERKKAVERLIQNAR